MAHKRSIRFWREQMLSDKALYEQAKDLQYGRKGYAPQGRWQIGTKIVKGRRVPNYAVGYYGKNYRESKAGFERAVFRGRPKN